jgi:diamine N-acetyltransferase
MLILGRFWIRAIERADLDFVLRVRNSPKTCCFLGSFAMLSRAGQEEWFGNLMSDKTRCCFVFGRGKVRIGYVRVSEIDWVNRSMCVGGDISEEYRGKGYGKEMYKLIFDLGFEKWNMNRLWLKVMANNFVAIRLYERCGFLREGIERAAILRDGGAVDYVRMSILRKEHRRAV